MGQRRHGEVKNSRQNLATAACPPTTMYSSTRSLARRLRAPAYALRAHEKGTGPLSTRRYASSLYNAPIAGLTDEQNQFRNAVHEFAQREIAPRAADIDKSNNFPAVRQGPVCGPALMRERACRTSGRSWAAWACLA